MHSLFCVQFCLRWMDLVALKGAIKGLDRKLESYVLLKLDYRYANFKIFCLIVKGITFPNISTVQVNFKLDAHW